MNSWPYLTELRCKQAVDMLANQGHNQASIGSKNDDRYHSIVAFLMHACMYVCMILPILL